MSKIGENIRIWTKMAEAIESGNWEGVKECAYILISNIEEIKTANGVYAIGFQRMYNAPQDVKDIILKYNELANQYREKERKKKKKDKKK